jgi:hypothetical protein
VVEVTVGQDDGVDVFGRIGEFPTARLATLEGEPVDAPATTNATTPAPTTPG